MVKSAYKVLGPGDRLKLRSGLCFESGRGPDSPSGPVQARP